MAITIPEQNQLINNFMSPKVKVARRHTVRVNTQQSTPTSISPLEQLVQSEQTKPMIMDEEEFNKQCVLNAFASHGIFVDPQSIECVHSHVLTEQPEIAVSEEVQEVSYDQIEQARSLLDIIHIWKDHEQNELLNDIFKILLMVGYEEDSFTEIYKTHYQKEILDKIYIIQNPSDLIILMNAVIRMLDEHDDISESSWFNYLKFLQKLSTIQIKG